LQLDGVVCGAGVAWRVSLVFPVQTPNGLFLVPGRNLHLLWTMSLRPTVTVMITVCLPTMLVGELKRRSTMSPSLKHAGIAGVLTGLALALDFTFFLLSGYSPTNFGSAMDAMAYLQQHGDLFLRIGGLFGAAGAVIRMIYVAGLAAKLRAKTPTQAVATLYFGVLGGIGHGLVALSFYVGMPMLLALAAQNQAAAATTLSAFTIMTSGFQAVGNVLLGLLLLGTGWAIIAHKALSVGVGWVGVLAGIATLLGVLTSGTPLAAVGFLTFIPSLLFATTFDIWVGVALWRSKSDLSPIDALSTTAALK
jgi:hypothetical protein